MTQSKRNRWALQREVDSILGQTMAGHFLYLIENVGEIIYPADSINIVPSLRKYESFQMTVCLAEIQICCCFCCCFTKIESLFGRTRVMSYTEDCFFPKKKWRSSFTEMYDVRQTSLLSAECSSFCCKFRAAGALMIRTFPSSLSSKKMTAGPSTRHCHLYALEEANLIFRTFQAFKATGKEGRKPM